MNSANDVAMRAANWSESALEDEGIDLLEYWAVIRRQLWVIVGSGAVVSVLAYLIASAMTPMFSSSARLLIETRQQNIVSIEELYGIDGKASEYFRTQLEIMNSRPLVERVVQDLQLTKHPEFDQNQAQPSVFSWQKYWPFGDEQKAAKVSDEAILRSAVSKVLANLSIDPIPNTTIVRIGFESADPELAFLVPNAMGEAYIEDNLESRVQLTQRATSWLTERLGGLREKLDESERALQAYREREDLVDVSGVETLAAKELSELSSRLVDARKRTAQAKVQLETVGTTESEFRVAWETLPGVVGDALIQQLKGDERRADSAFAEIRQRYGPKHPKFIAAQAQLASARDAYRSRVERVVSGFQSAYDQALADQRELERGVERARQETQNLNRKRFDLTELERQVETNRQLYDLFFRRFQETSAASFEAANARFVDKALRPGGPVKPRKTYTAAVSGILSMLAAIGLIFLREMMDNTVRSAEEVESKLHQGLIGVLPFEKSVGKSSQSASQLYFSKEHFGFSEAVRSLRTSVVLASVDDPHKIIVVTSSVPGEGKTTVASNLAVALGQMEKVLLIDADMRRPSLASDYELGSGIVGLAELVANSAEGKDCIHRLKDRRLDILPAGSVPPNPLDLLSSQRFAKLLQTLSQNYDRIVIDSAPTQSVSDSLVLSRYADALIYVVRSDATAASIAKNGIERLLRVGAPVIGVVLNQFDPESSSRYGYYGTSGKYGYYGHGYASKTYS